MTGISSARGGLVLCQQEIIPRESAARSLSAHGWAVVATGRVEELLELLGRGYETVVVDLDLPGLDGRALLRDAQELEPGVDVVLLASPATIESAVAVMAEGAADFLTKPVRIEELELRLRRLRAIREQRDELARLRSILGDPAALPEAHLRPFTLHLDGQDRVQLPDLVRRFEDEIIAWALGRARGEHGIAAQILGVPVSALERRRGG